MDTIDTVFVYGTLLEGEPNNLLLDNSVNLGQARLRFPGWMVAYCSGFPALWETKDVISSIKGEVYYVDDTTMASLDVLEGYPSFYDRKVMIANMLNGETIPSWVYIVTEDCSDMEIIRDGDWRLYKATMLENMNAY